MKFRIMQVILCYSSFHVAAAQGTKDGLESLQWMAGCWQAKNEGNIVEEQWMKPLGQMMVGAGRTTSKGKSRFFEFLQIVLTDSGTFYVARPKGNPPTSFRLVKSGSKEVVFENLAHDFPQRIIYKRGGDALLARVEGMVKGELKYEEFRYDRAQCE